MYQIEVRLYQIKNEIQAYGQYTRDNGSGELYLASAKASIDFDPENGDDLHVQMMIVASRVCQRIAQNLSPSLF